MAITLVNSATVVNDTTDTTVFSGSYTVNDTANVLVIAVGGMEAVVPHTGISAATLNGTSIMGDLVLESLPTGGKQSSSIFLVSPASTGAQTIEITFNASNRACLVFVAEYSGVSAATAVSTDSGGDGGGGSANSATLSFTTSADNALIVGHVTVESDETPFTATDTEILEAATSGGTEFNDVSGSLFSKSVASAGATTTGTSWASSESYAYAGVELAAASGGSGSSSRTGGGFGLGLSLGLGGASASAPLAAPIVANQSFDYGDHSIAGEGAFIVETTGGSISTISIDSGDASNHFQAVGNRISITAAGRTAALSGSPYTLGITATNGAGSDTATITVTAIANGWSVSDIDELKNAGEASDLAYGDTIYLRGGTYNASYTRTNIKRNSTAPTGTKTFPSTLLDASHSDKGIDVTTGNLVTITKHSGTSPVIGRFEFDMNFDDGAGNPYSSGFRITGLDFASGLGSDHALLDVVNSSATDNVDIIVDNCTFTGPSGFDGADLTNMPSGLDIGSGSNIIVRDCTFNHLKDGITSQDNANIQIIGNTMQNIWNDCIKVRAPDDGLFNWNVLYDKQHPDAALAAHADFIQLLGATSSRDNIRFIGNRIFRGTGRSGYVDGQGIFIDDTVSPDYLTNVVIRGNFVQNTMGNGILIRRGQTVDVRWNTVITDPGNTPTDTGVGNTPKIALAACDGGTVSQNIAAVISEISAVSAATITANVTVDEDATTDPTQYSAVFTNPVDSDTLTPASVLTTYSAKTSGPADTASPKAGAVGTGYVDYANRETSFP